MRYIKTFRIFESAGIPANSFEDWIKGCLIPIQYESYGDEDDISPNEIYDYEIPSEVSFSSDGKKATIKGGAKLVGNAEIEKYLQDPSFSIKVSPFTNTDLSNNDSYGEVDVRPGDLVSRASDIEENGAIIIEYFGGKDFICLKSEIECKHMTIEGCNDLLTIEGAYVEEDLYFHPKIEVLYPGPALDFSKAERKEYFLNLLGDYGDILTTEQMNYIFLEEITQKDLQAIIKKDPAEAVELLKSSWSKIKKKYPELKFPKEYEDGIEDFSGLSDLGF